MVEAKEALDADAEDKLLQNVNIFEPAANSIDEVSLEFTVRDPIKQSGTTLYKVTGRDREGLFEGLRRYNEFFLLHETLRTRWPGVPIPVIPPKKAVGNTDTVFV